MGSKLNPKEELMALMAIKELKEATLEEVEAKLKDKWETEIPPKKIIRYLRRWRKAKTIVANMVGKQWVYSLRDIPWYPEAQMIHVVKPDISETEAKEFLDNYREELKDRGYIATRQPDIRDYETFEVTMEVIDCIAGGNLSPSDDENMLLFPRLNGELIIPRSWLVGWLRDNARLVNMPQSIKWNIGVTEGRFSSQPKIAKKTVIGKKGPQTHETIGAGVQFTFTLSYPMHGTPIKSEDDLTNYFKTIEKAPIRGLGAYDRAFGGRVKLIEMKNII